MPKVLVKFNKESTRVKYCLDVNKLKEFEAVNITKVGLYQKGNEHLPWIYSHDSFILDIHGDDVRYTVIMEK